MPLLGPESRETCKCESLGDEGGRLLGLAKSQTVKCDVEVTDLEGVSMCSHMPGQDLLESKSNR